MYLKRYNYYPTDLGDFVIMDDEFDLPLATCGNETIANTLVQALNDMEMLDPSKSTKLH